MKLSLVVLATVTIIACTRERQPDTPVSEFPPDEGKHVTGDGIGTPIGDACQHIGKLGCSEGMVDPKTGRTCFQTFVHASTALHVEVPAACLTTAPSVAAVRACGDANTIRVSCAGVR